MTSPGDDDQGGLEQIGHADRVASLTGVRAVAALTVMGTHAAYGTGLLSQGYLGLMSARLEVGVAIFFVLSGLLLFRPWVRAAAMGAAAPSTRRYARNRFRRIMPAYVVTVLIVYGVYELRPVQPNPGHTWTGLLRNLTLTQIYSDNYFTDYLHQGLSQMWSLAVEVAFYAVLPLLAYLLLVVLCRRRFRPALLLAGLAVLAAVSPLWLVLLHTADWMPVGGGAWLPHYLVWFVGGMTLAALGTMGVRVYALAALPLALACYLVVSTPIAGRVTAPALGLSEDLAKTLFYAVIATLVVAPLALGADGLYARLMGSRPMVALGEISYEVFLLHVVAMDLVMEFVLGWNVYTGSATVLFVVTLAVTVPFAWLLHRVTRPRG
ncbi:acyltransferase [Mycolicibacterium conceptionense]|uniref:Acyltransferase n=2 Tax=Mycolicibacterium TaxID=1866885 RepID=A0A1A2VMN5_9MYCO|nr:MULTISPECIES: acyltransferase [Mycolicibacterium]MCW1821250.1 acyltransferase [Mycolicibacterium senegalense]OBB13187.1 acyltransferase [Mycolicibacterium conceptionense]OBE98438.1 acyltransferase [Mycolicibacterium conceptionense]OBF14967.1 acyltransferase [Mycolicibacterium conceptionense]OBF30701.1 acyltransferase [Mycolicibacterium conceptionense]